ncbi:MAG: YkgJ family cysteine cluster protein [Alphaproteobacteria bacterium]|nr:YkgJ family cysteine cluster protein [Alphaproteobacteria bacterium]
MSDGPLPYELILESGIRGLTEAAVASGAPARLNALVDEALALAEGLLTSLRTLNPPEQPAACREGCAHCCRFQVAVTPPEVLAIAETVRQRDNADGVAALAARCADLATAERGVDAAGRVRIRRPCVLLHEERCTVYAVRPLACRGANATDAEHCAAALDGADIRLLLYAHQANVMKAAARGLNHAKRPEDGQLELTAALAIALNENDAAGRWMAGEPIFAGARLPRGTTANKIEGDPA